MSFSLPKLNYEFNALEPYIDKETVSIHYTKHHQTYLDKLNSTISEAHLEKLDIVKLLTFESDNLNLVKSLTNFGGGYANHNLYWNTMTPGGSKLSKGGLLYAICNTFGNFDSFKNGFTEKALGLFGSGWTWLVIKNSELEILNTLNQDSPIKLSYTPILCIDLWEHAYYLKYQNRRADYINAWWNVVSWDAVEELFNKSA